MPSFENLVIVVAVAFFAPLVLGLFPRVRLPSVVLEIVAGIVIGPSVLGLVEVDQSVEVIALIGLRDFAVAAALASQAFGPSAATVAGVYGVLMLLVGAAAAQLLRRQPPAPRTP